MDAFVVTGVLADARTVTLDEPLPLAPTKVRLVVEPLLSSVQRPYRDVIAAIRRRQRARGHRPPTAEEVDAHLLVERQSWDV